MSPPCRTFSLLLVGFLMKSALLILPLQMLSTLNCPNCQTTTTTMSERHKQHSMTCTTTNTSYCNDVDMDHYLRPLDYNLTEVLHEITNGKGFFILRQGFSQSDVRIARLIVDHLTKHNRVDTNTDNTQKQNSYDGLIWNLLGNGKIFEKIAQHPVTLEIARALLGPKSQISSYVSNTVQPGMGAQIPHLDYPYYDGYFPSGEHNIQRPLLCASFMVLLSKFTVTNGGTAFRPGSQKQPSHPHDVKDFYRNTVQLEGEPGDIGIFGGSIQHGAMANNDIEPRVGIIQTMIPVYVKPYHDMEVSEEMLSKASQEMRTLLAADHPYPMKHG